MTADGEITFDTDIDITKGVKIIPDIAVKSAFAMITQLWGGKETSILAMLRALSVADMAVSINRDQMIDRLREEAQTLCQCIEDSKREMMSRGIKVYTFSPQSPKANKS